MHFGPALSAFDKDLDILRSWDLKSREGGFFSGNALDSLMKVVLSLMKNVLIPLTKSILIPLGLTKTVSSTGAAMELMVQEVL